MSAFDLRTWLEKVEAAGELKKADGVPLMHEVGAVSDFTRHAHGPAILFDKFQGYAPGFRVLTGSNSSAKRMAITMGLEGEYSNLDLVNAIVKKLDYAEEHLKEYDYQYVDDGPIFENQLFGDDVNLYKIPVPTWHEQDGGPYIGTGLFQVHVDPDTGFTNAGTYRVMQMNEKQVGNFIGPGHHGHTIRKKFWDRGEPCPVVMCIGGHPLFFLLGSTDVNEGISEFNVAGAICNEKVEMVKGKITGLPIPACCEIALEGYIYPENQQKEGPFGEFTGYYGRGMTEKEYYMDVSAIYYRNDPILLGAPPCIPPHDFSYSFSVMRAAAVQQSLAKAGVPGVRGCWATESGCGRMWLVTSIKQCYDGHATQAGVVAAYTYQGNVLNKWSVVVDDDIDPTNLEQVNWAMSTRCNPETDIDILRDSTTTPLDPILPPESKQAGIISNSRAIVRATRPFHRVKKNNFVPVVWASPELEKKVKEKWGHLGLF